MPAFSKQQLDLFLRRPLIARIATLLTDGMPTITPIWFEWNPKSKTFLLWAQERYGGLNSGWHDNLAKDTSNPKARRSTKRIPQKTTSETIYLY